MFCFVGDLLHDEEVFSNSGKHDIASYEGYFNQFYKITFSGKLTAVKLKAVETSNNLTN